MILINFFSILHIASFIVTTIFLFFLLRQPNKNESIKAMLWLLIFADIWVIFGFIASFVTLPQEYHTLAWKFPFISVGIVTLLILRFIVVFTKRKVNSIIYVIIGLLYSTLTVFTLATDQIITSTKSSLWMERNSTTGDLFIIMGIVLVLPMALSIYFALKSYRENNSVDIYKKQLRIIIFGLLFPLIMATITDLIFLAINIDFPRLATVSGVIMLAFFFYAIYKYEALEIKVIFFETTRSRILFGFFVSALIPLIVISYLSFITSTRSLSESALNELKVDSFVHAEKIDLALNRIGNDVLFVSNLPPVQGSIRAIDSEDNIDVTEGSTYEQWIDRFSNILEGLLSSKMGVYTQFRYINEEGDELLRLDSDGERIWRVSEEKLQNKKDRYYFTEAIAVDKGELYISNLDLNREGSPSKVEIPYKPVIRYATPIFDTNDKRRGVIIANVFANSFLKDLGLESNIIKTEEHVAEKEYLIDKDGSYFVHPAKKKEWGGLNDLNTGENFTKDFPEISQDALSGNASAKNINGLAVSYAPVFFDENNKERFWVVLDTVSEDVVFGDVKSLRNTILVFGFLILLFVVLLALIISRSIAKPILALQEGAEIIEKGNLDHKVGTKSTDDVGKLSRAFDKMTDLIKQSREEIDKKVEEQTKEIALQNKDSEDQRKAVLNILEDVEEEKGKVENIAQDLEKFKLAVDNASDHIVITDTEGTVMYANKAAEKVTGFTVQEIMGKKAGKLWGGVMDKKFYKKMWDTISIDKEPFSGEITNRRKNKEEYIALSRISPIINKHGVVEFFVGIERDITKEKQVDQAKTEFVSLASHQLRTPLSTINWYAEMLLAGDAGKITEDQKKYLQEIYHGNQRMVDLVNALLNVSRLELGTFVVEPEQIDILKITRSVLDELKPKVDEKKLIVKEEHQGDLPEINADPKLTRIIIQNLLSNAVKYTPESGKVDVGISLKHKGELVEGKPVIKDSVLISVKDTGYGIPEHQQDKMFTKLFRADNVKEKDTEGTGLGLYIIKSILNQCNGKVWFKSIEDKGTTFYILMPVSGMIKKEGSKQLE
jgi:methyl-accepting chemotaxis protein